MDEFCVCQTVTGHLIRYVTDEDVGGESNMIWGDADPDRLATVCEECFKAVMAQISLITSSSFVEVDGDRHAVRVSRC